MKELISKALNCDCIDVKGKIFDSHLGSGSNRIANHLNGNDFYGCEINEIKFLHQEKRFKDYLSQLRLEF